jgi:hypothetical protein
MFMVLTPTYLVLLLVTMGVKLGRRRGDAMKHYDYNGRRRRKANRLEAWRFKKKRTSEILRFDVKNPVPVEVP